MSGTIFPATGMPDPDWWEALWPRPDRVVALLGVEPWMAAIDLCCGDGLFTAALSRIAAHVVGIDLDPRLLDLARTRAAALHLGNCAFIVGDAYDLARLAPGPVDFILLANTFHGVPDKARLASAVAAVLRPGGRFAVVNWHRRPREETTVLDLPRGPRFELRMAPEELAAAVAPAGLRLLRTVDLPPYHYGAIFAPTVSPGKTDACFSDSGDFVRDARREREALDRREPAEAPSASSPHNRDRCGRRPGRGSQALRSTDWH